MFSPGRWAQPEPWEMDARWRMSLGRGGRDNTMGHTYSNLLCHCVFSTKGRRKVFPPDLMPRLAEFAGGILRNRGAQLLAFNGPEDHVHTLTIFVPKLAVSDQVRDLKAGTSKWIHDTHPNMRDFAWQEGYSVFAVSRSAAKEVTRYIENQQAHHKTATFEEELVAFLERHGIDYDPQYVFD